MANEERAGDEPEQTAPTVTGEQGAAPENAEQPTGQAEKYITAGEFNRKLGRLQEDQQRTLTMLQYIAAQQQQVRPQAPVSQGAAPLTDEELWTRAQQGDQEAFREWTRREARREYESRQQTAGKQTLVEAQLNALARRYPVLNDSSHPLTQKAHTAYQLLVNAGYPANRATLLEAATTAIADSPDLVSELYSQGAQAREHSRQSGVRSAQSGVTGASYRNEPAPRREGQVRDTSAPEADLARRMGIKDPKAAKERFLKRQQAGQSTIDPRMLPIVERSMEDF